MSDCCDCAFFYQYATDNIPLKLQYCDGTGGVLEGYKDIKVTLSQAGVTLTKGLDELGVDVDEDTVILPLTQEETGLFATMACEVQVNIFYDDSERDTSTRGKIMVRKNLYKEIMNG